MPISRTERQRRNRPSLRVSLEDPPPSGVLRLYSIMKSAQQFANPMVLRMVEYAVQAVLEALVIGLDGKRPISTAAGERLDEADELGQTRRELVTLGDSRGRDGGCLDQRPLR